MKLDDVLVLYLIAGAACAIALYRRSAASGGAAVLNALIAVPLWPVWAPVTWTARRERLDLDARSSARVSAIRRALDEGVASVLGTPLERLLNRASADQIFAQVERVAARHQELASLLGRSEFSAEVAARKLDALEREGAAARVRASARLHLENVRRLQQLAERDAAALEELSGLVTALRTQLVLVRLSGSSAEGVGDLVSELWARIEGLSEVEAVSVAHSG